MAKSTIAEWEEPIYRIEAHIWFENFDDYVAREKKLRELLGELHGDSSIIVFFRATPEYLEIPRAGYDHMSDEQAEKLIDFCGRDNIDFVVRVSRDTGRKKGYLRGKPKRIEQ